MSELYQPKSLSLLTAEKINITLDQYNSKIKNTCLDKDLKNVILTNLIFKEKIQKFTKFTKNYELKKENILLSGYVQSGKTSEMLGYCWWSIYIAKLPVIMLVRNYKIDLEQLEERIKLLNNNVIGNKYKKFHLKLDKINDTGKIRKKAILAGLTNHSQTYKIWELIKKSGTKYHLCIDEADYAIKSIKNTSKLEQKLKYIEKFSSHTLRATATQFAVIVGRKDLTKVIKMSEPKNYKNIDFIKKKFVEVKKGYNIAKNPNEDPNIDTIYYQFLQKEKGIILHLVSKLKIAHKILMNELASRFDNLTVVCFNGDGAFIRTHKNHDDHELFPMENFQERYEKLTITRRIGNYVVHHLKKIQINEVLQILKDDITPHKHISIISGNMVSRGVSVVSEDYEWHLTDQYFHPSDYAHGENIIQSLRILGCYNDNNPLTLWCTKQTWLDIKEQYKILNKYIDSCKDNPNEKAYKKISTVSITKPRRTLTRPKIMSGVGVKDKKIVKDKLKVVLEIQENVSEDENYFSEDEIKL